MTGCGVGAAAAPPVPGQIDVVEPPPAIQGPLRRGRRPQPVQRDQLLARGLDAAQVDAEGVGDPARLAAPAAVQPPAAYVEATAEEPEDGGDEGGPGAAGEESEDAPGDGEPALAVADLLEHG